MGDALAHSVLPGMVVAFLLGISPFYAAVPTGILVALSMGSVARRTGVSEDTSIGIIFAGMFALGLVMLSSADNINVNIEDLLLGQVLGVSRDGRLRFAGVGRGSAGGTLCFPPPAHIHHLRPCGGKGDWDQDGIRGIRAPRPPCPRHRDWHTGGGDSLGHGDADNSRGGGVPARQKVRSKS